MLVTVRSIKAKNRFIEAHKKSKLYSLTQCYTNPSQRKQDEFYRCLREEEADGGYSGKIIAYNTYVFTYAYKCIINNQEYLKVITKNHFYLIKIGE